MNRPSQVAAKLLKKMEDQAEVEGSYIARKDRRKVLVLGYALGFLIVGLIALWMAHRP